MKQNDKNTTTPAAQTTCSPQPHLEPTLNDPEWLASMDADLDPRSTLLAKLTAPERARVYEALVSGVRWFGLMTHHSAGGSSECVPLSATKYNARVSIPRG